MPKRRKYVRKRAKHKVRSVEKNKMVKRKVVLADRTDTVKRRKVKRNRNDLEVGHHEVQGVRDAQEDAHVIYRITSLGRKKRIHVTAKKSAPAYVFGIFDGHGGKKASKFMATHTAKAVENHLTLGQYPVQAVIDAVRWTDIEFFKQNIGDTSGTTAILALLETEKKRLWIANLGDSRAILCRNGKAYALSRDHDKGHPLEKRRLTVAGGMADEDGYLCHRDAIHLEEGIQMSRSLGDRDVKYFQATDDSPVRHFEGIIAIPEVRYDILTSQDEFLLLACDGLFEAYTNAAAIKEARKMFANGLDCKAVAKHLCETAVQKGSEDNVSCLLIKLFKKTS